jgi:hypothetical protein
MANELVALLGGIEVGRVHRDSKGRLTFIYDDAWREANGAYPLSLSMPLAAKEHKTAVSGESIIPPPGRNGPRPIPAAVIATVWPGPPVSK